ncbi:nose resistant to fluoxetine protein 6-like [Haemaphysalis longicornis]
MFDSTGKPESGVLTGGLTFLGSYSECLAAVAESTLTEEQWNSEVRGSPFSSQYCLVTTVLPHNHPVESETQNISEFFWNQVRDNIVRIGICVPSTCSERDATVFGSQLLKKIGGPENTTSATCSAYMEPYISTWAVVIVTCVLSVHVAVVAAATACDIRARCRAANKLRQAQMCSPSKSTSSAWLEKKQLAEPDEDQQVNRFLLCLSLLTNLEKLFNTKSATGDSIAIIHGIRLFSMNLIILGHTASIALKVLIFRNAGEFPTLRDTVPVQIVANLTPVVDTFFMLSGLLIVYLSLKRLDEAEGKMNWCLFYLHRYWSSA